MRGINTLDKDSTQIKYILYVLVIQIIKGQKAAAPFGAALENGKKLDASMRLSSDENQSKRRICLHSPKCLVCAVGHAWNCLRLSLCFLLFFTA